MATELVKATLNGTWTDVAGTAASQLGVQWQNIGGFPIGLSFSTSAPGATDPYVTLAPGQTFQDNPGSAHVWAACFGGSSIVCAILNPGGGGGGGGGGAATIADGADVAEGATTATAYSDTTGAAAGTLVGINKGKYVLVASLTGALTETAPATDTASSGLNGRLQRIAQRLTSLIALLPASLGSKLSAASFSIVPASDSTFAVTQGTASNLNAQVVGAGASGSTAVGNPVGGAGIYKTTPLTLTDGQRGDLLLGTRQALKVQFSLPDNVNSVGFQGASSDGFSSTSVNAYNSFSFLSVYNGTASGWDRSRSITGALADGTGLGVAAVEQAGALFNNISTAATTTVKSGKGILHKIVLNTYVASATITIYDNTAASSTKIGTITLPSTITGDTPITLPYDLQFSTGLTIVTSGATDITVIYR